MIQPLITIIIPVYNVEKYIEKCIISVKINVDRHSIICAYNIVAVYIGTYALLS